jgi:hypothetical protein
MSHATSQNAQRMVGLYATWPLPMQLPAAFTALTGLKDSAYTATITGKDACNGGADSVAGITTPINTWVNKINEAPTGKPPFDTLQTQAQVAAETHIDWASIMAGALSANLEIPPSSWPSAGSAQGIALWGDTTNYPVIRIHTNNYTLPAVNNEFGLIICDSNCYNLTNQWKGVILVGGVLTQDHGNTLTGAAVTGLNSLIGGNPGPSLINTQSNAFLYSSCAVASATKRLQPKQVYSPIPNSWTDNIAIY